jgi:hypothetical protein
MLWILRAALAALACAVLTACAATGALESQSKPASAQSARIYILRPAATAGSAVAANVKIDGVAVGHVANNSFFFVDRPPGRHKIEVRLTAALAGVEQEVQVEAGRTHYFAFNALDRVTTKGERQIGQTSVLGNGYIAEFEEAAGAEAVTQMKAAAQAQSAVRVGRPD